MVVSSADADEASSLLSNSPSLSSCSPGGACTASVSSSLTHSENLQHIFVPVTSLSPGVNVVMMSRSVVSRCIVLIVLGAICSCSPLEQKEMRREEGRKEGHKGNKEEHNENTNDEKRVKKKKNRRTKQRKKARKGGH